MALYRYINSRRGQTSVIPDLTHDNGSTASRGEDKANLLALKLLKAYNSQTDELPYFAECSSSPAPPLLLCRLLWGSTGKKLLSILVTEFFIYHPRLHSSRFFKEDCSILAVPLEHIYNLSYMKREVPLRWKHALITPILRKPPVLTFISCAQWCLTRRSPVAFAIFYYTYELPTVISRFGVVCRMCMQMA